jgi:hypothetical protein
MVVKAVAAKRNFLTGSPRYAEFAAAVERAYLLDCVITEASKKGLYCVLRDTALYAVEYLVVANLPLRRSLVARVPRIKTGGQTAELLEARL